MWTGPTVWRMNDRGLEAEQERRLVYSIPYPETMLAQWRRGKGVLQGTSVSAFRERVKKKMKEDL